MPATFFVGSRITVKGENIEEDSFWKHEIRTLNESRATVYDLDERVWIVWTIMGTNHFERCRQPFVGMLHKAWLDRPEALRRIADSGARIAL